MPFVNHFSMDKWGNPLQQKSFDTLINLTKLHPYYFNALLRLIFICETIPSPAEINAFWYELAGRKRNDLVTEIKDLSIAHKKMLVAIANGINSDLTSQKFLARAELPSATALRALDFLVKNAFIERIENHYQLIDPLLETIIQQLQRF